MRLSVQRTESIVQRVLLENEQRNLVLADFGKSILRPAPAANTPSAHPPAKIQIPANSGRLNVNGIRPWNHGFTV